MPLFVLLASEMVGNDFRKGARPGEGLSLRVESGDEAVMSSQWENTVLIAAGYDPYQLADLGVAAAARLSGLSSRALKTQNCFPQTSS